MIIIIIINRDNSSNDTENNVNGEWKHSLKSPVRTYATLRLKLTVFCVCLYEICCLFWWPIIVGYLTVAILLLGIMMIMIIIIIIIFNNI